MLCLNISNISIITVKDVGYCCIIYGISKSEAIHLLKNAIHDGCGYIKNSHPLWSTSCSYHMKFGFFGFYYLKVWK